MRLTAPAHQIAVHCYKHGIHRTDVAQIRDVCRYAMGAEICTRALDRLCVMVELRLSLPSRYRLAAGDPPTTQPNEESR